MKFRKILATGCLALASLALVAASANAQTPVVTNVDDLFLCFYTTATQGQTSDYIVDLGQASNYMNGTDVNFSYALGADLTAIYGAGWSTSSSLYWGVYGDNSFESGSPGNYETVGNDPGAAGSIATIYLSKAESTVGTQSAAPFEYLTFAHLASPSRLGGSLNNMIWGGSSGGGFADVTLNNGGLLNTSTADNPYGFIENTATDGFIENFSSFGPAANNLPFDSYTLGNFGNGVDGTALDLYQQIARDSNSDSPVTYAGTFTMDNNGDVMFTANPALAVPEPSTYAMMGLGMAGMLFIVRRRNRSALAA